MENFIFCAMSKLRGKLDANAVTNAIFLFSNIP